MSRSRLLSVGLLAVFLIACGDDEAIGPSPFAGNTVTVAASDFRFDPNLIEVISGQSLTVVLQNQAGSQHDITFALPDRLVTMGAVDPGGTGQLELTAPAPGDYTFYCSIGNHRALGMTGTLRVTAAAGAGEGGTGGPGPAY